MANSLLYFAQLASSFIIHSLFLSVPKCVESSICFSTIQRKSVKHSLLRRGHKLPNTLNKNIFKAQL
ncbi:hypothetical protein EB796_013283 [Bugula neritina]|uniref:Uncharacterized protein n=1 Tax=Bugula neritina TaxID=10212 RepID=A0A7J7JRV8_BUGNE|nr:hypothetical protein EB796_013283 [Bugula neritina]